MSAVSNEFLVSIAGIYGNNQVHLKNKTYETYSDASYISEIIWAPSEFLHLHIGENLRWDETCSKFKPVSALSEAFKIYNGDSLHTNRIQYYLTRLPQINDLSGYFISNKNFCTKTSAILLGHLDAVIRTGSHTLLKKLIPNQTPKLNNSFKSIYDYFIGGIDFAKKSELLARYINYDLSSPFSVQQLANDYSVGISVIKITQLNEVTKFTILPDFSEIIPIPIMKLLVYDQFTCVLYTENECENDGFKNGTCIGAVQKEKSRDSFYFTDNQSEELLILFSKVTELVSQIYMDPSYTAQNKNLLTEVMKKSEELITVSGESTPEKLKESFNILTGLKTKFEQKVQGPSFTINAKRNDNGVRAFTSPQIVPNQNSAFIPGNGLAGYNAQNSPFLRAPNELPIDNRHQFNVPNEPPVRNPQSSGQVVNNLPRYPTGFTNKTVGLDSTNPVIPIQVPNKTVAPPINNYPPDSSYAPRQKLEPYQMNPSQQKPINIPVVPPKYPGNNLMSNLDPSSKKNEIKAIESRTIMKPSQCKGCMKNISGLEAFHDSCKLCNSCLFYSIYKNNKSCASCLKRVVVPQTLLNKQFKCAFCNKITNSLSIQQCNCLRCLNCVSTTHKCNN